MSKNPTPVTVALPLRWVKWLEEGRPQAAMTAERALAILPFFGELEVQLGEAAMQARGATGELSGEQVANEDPEPLA